VRDFEIPKTKLIDRTPKLTFSALPHPPSCSGRRRVEDVEESGDEQHEEAND
jgi:hypothetical protein